MVNVNGTIADQEHAVIPVFDHGFLYGEGIYETLRTYDGRPFLFERHMRRLRTSASLIDLQIPLSDEAIAARIRETQAASGHTGGDAGEAYIRLLITRGVGDLTYDPEATPRPSVVVIVKPHSQLSDAVYRAGVAVVIVPMVRNHPDSVSPRIKSNNLLNNALAAQQALRRGGFEAVMRNHRGELVECATANLFIVRKGRVVTPPLDAGLLAGITREYLFEVGAAAGISIEEATLHDDDLLGADEAFLTGTTREVLGISRVDDRTIGSGVTGPITLQLLEAFRARTGAGAQ